MANEDAYFQSAVSDAFLAWHGSGSGEQQGYYAVGQSVATPGLYYDGALRFPSILIAQGASVDFAQLRLYASEQGTANSIKMKTYGIKETNTAAFSTNPFGRPQTTAVTTQTSGLPGVGAFIGVSVTSQVNEILAQGGWASGNAMGFLVFDNNSDSNAYMGDTTRAGQLIIRVSAEPNFFPTPGSVAAPTFPTTSHQGLKISLPGYDVRQATEPQLLLTTRKKEFKILLESNVDCTGSVEKLVAHGLSYAPAHLAYVEGGGYRFKLNRLFGGAVDPVTGGVQGQVGADSTNLRITVGGNKNVYYYIFIDTLNES